MNSMSCFHYLFFIGVEHWKDRGISGKGTTDNAVSVGEMDLDTWTMT